MIMVSNTVKPGKWRESPHRAGGMQIFLPPLSDLKGLRIGLQICLPEISEPWAVKVGSVDQRYGADRSIPSGRSGS